jgi:hypothetical protein
VQERAFREYLFLIKAGSKHPSKDSKLKLEVTVKHLLKDVFDPVSTLE